MAAWGTSAQGPAKGPHSVAKEPRGRANPTEFSTYQEGMDQNKETGPMTTSTLHSSAAGLTVLNQGEQAERMLYQAVRGARRPVHDLPVHLQILRDELKAAVARRLPWSFGDS